MNGQQAVALVVEEMPEALMVAANGSVSRWLIAVDDRPATFYMLGSIGLASSIGAGVALACPDRMVVVLDGDGDALVGLSALPLIGTSRLGNLVHVVLNNLRYGATGGQRSLTEEVALERVAVACGYSSVQRVSGEAGVRTALEAFVGSRDPRAGASFLLVEIELTSVLPPRVMSEPDTMAERFRRQATDPLRAGGSNSHRRSSDSRRPARPWREHGDDSNGRPE